MWTWTSMTPGKTMRPDASITLRALGALEFAPTQETFPSFAATAQLRSDDDMATLPFTITRSAELKLSDGPKPGLHYLLLFWRRPRTYWTSLRRTTEAVTIMRAVKAPM